MRFQEQHPLRTQECLGNDNHFRELKYRQYFVGIAESGAEFGCKYKGDMVYQSITTCTVENSNSMWIHGEPNNYGGYGEWCVESTPNNYRGLNSVSGGYTGTYFTICEFYMHCNAKTQTKSIEIFQTTNHKNINNDSDSEGQNQNDGTNDDGLTMMILMAKTMTPIMITALIIM